MPIKSFFKENFVLVVGLSLPVLLIVGFMVATNLPQLMSDPPKYDLVFATTDYPPNAGNLPVSVRFVVKNGVLTAEYARTALMSAGYVYSGWKKLYLYEAKTQKVRELTFGFPPDMGSIVDTKEETVAATKDMKLDTTLQSPDGYELSYDAYSNSGLLNEVFWGSTYNHEPRLKHGSSSVPLSTGDGRTNFYYNGVEFVGWVTASR